MEQRFPTPADIVDTVGIHCKNEVLRKQKVWPLTLKCGSNFSLVLVTLRNTTVTSHVLKYPMCNV